MLSDAVMHRKVQKRQMDNKGNTWCCRVPELYSASKGEAHSLPTSAEQHTEKIIQISEPEADKVPKLQRAGPSEAFSKLHIERSGPSGNFSKLYGLKFRAFAQDLSHLSDSCTSPQ